MGVATVESLTKLLTLARSQRGLALHLSAHAYLSEKASGAGDGSEMGQHMFLAEIMENHGKSIPSPGMKHFGGWHSGFFHMRSSGSTGHSFWSLLHATVSIASL